MKALVTGATGFIGSHLTEELIKRGYEVTCLVRKASNLRWLERLDAKFVQGDCSDSDSLSACVKYHDYIFHLAGLTKANCKEDFYTVNTKGTENIIQAAARHDTKIRRFVHVSSLSAFGPVLSTALPSDDSEPHPVSDYGRSKLKAEEAVMSHRSAVPVCVLRPAAVYGPRDQELFLLFKFINRGFIPYWGDGSVSMLYVDDLVNAIILSAESEKAVGKIYFISDGRIYSNNEIINEIASALSINVNKIRLHRSLLPAIGFFSQGISKIIGKRTMINRDKLRELMYTDWVCNITNAKNDLCFQPRVEIKKGIKWTADWYKIHKWL
ncbi:MAG: NAD(P)-dependent oxidoreductase [Nitrospirae bacterium]|nr:NAD(P)-dependent oxidoreductase [Nitrospirota bacterium]